MNQEMTMRDSVAPSQQEQHQQFHNDVIGNGQHQHINGDNNNRDPHTQVSKLILSIVHLIIWFTIRY